jgi:hypothetical protein
MSNTGGPACPTEHTDTSGLYDGMTLRDYFAAKAMQALITRIPMSGAERARDAYTIADAMLKAREQK